MKVFKQVEMIKIKNKTEIFNGFKKHKIIKSIIIKLIIISIIFFKIFYIYDRKSKNIEINFNYTNYQKSIINSKILNESGWELSENQAFFLNGIIRKYSPKNCLEIGVSEGGSSILILNAIKDKKNSILVSLDLNTKWYKDPSKITGWRVKNFFPELTKKWRLFTGDQPHKFLVKLNIKFDFLFLDTSHISPGELINIIEAMPFLNENAIIVLHDIIYHPPIFNKKNEIIAKISTPNLHLMTFLYGEKIILKKQSKLDNMGAIFLHKYQYNHYQDYFLSLMTIWDYMPSNEQLKDLRNFIQNYYKNDDLLEIYDESVRFNKEYFIKYKKKYDL